MSYLAQFSRHYAYETACDLDQSFSFVTAVNVIYSSLTIADSRLNML